jgi:hypothetical protein
MMSNNSRAPKSNRQKGSHGNLEVVRVQLGPIIFVNAPAIAALQTEGGRVRRL